MECFEVEHNMMWAINALLRTDDREETALRNLADPKVRPQIANILERALARDTEAAGHIERALAK